MKDMFQINRVPRVKGAVLQQHKVGDTEYLSFPILEQTGCVRHLFSTRLGGVSEGIFAAMNLSFHRGDEETRVVENYRRIGAVLGVEPENMVSSHQTHTTNIRLVTGADRGKGVVRPLDYEDVDGLITKEPGIALVTSYADCVPLYFVDPVRKAIGLAHSGWRGTVAQMGMHMVEAMQTQFGSNPKDLVAAIGPSICRSCYEVSEEVAEEFEIMLAGTEELVTQIRKSGCYAEKTAFPKVVEEGRKPGKYQLDLWLANLIILMRAGIPLAQIEVTDICTCHNPEYLFSHRASEGKRGNLAAFLMLRES